MGPDTKKPPASAVYLGLGYNQPFQYSMQSSLPYVRQRASEIVLDIKTLLLYFDKVALPLSHLAILPSDKAKEIRDLSIVRYLEKFIRLGIIEIATTSKVALEERDACLKLTEADSWSGVPGKDDAALKRILSMAHIEPRDENRWDGFLARFTDTVERLPKSKYRNVQLSCLNASLDHLQHFNLADVLNRLATYGELRLLSDIASSTAYDYFLYMKESYDEAIVIPPRHLEALLLQDNPLLNWPVMLFEVAYSPRLFLRILRRTANVHAARVLAMDVQEIVAFRSQDYWARGAFAYRRNVRKLVAGRRPENRTGDDVLASLSENFDNVYRKTLLKSGLSLGEGLFGWLLSLANPLYPVAIPLIKPIIQLGIERYMNVSQFLGMNVQLQRFFSGLRGIVA